MNDNRENKVIEFPGARDCGAGNDIPKKKSEEIGVEDEERAGGKLGKAARELTEEFNEPDKEKSGDKDKKNPFARRLRQLIKERDIRVTDLAWGAGIAPKTVYSFLNGYTFPSVETLLNMSAYLGVSVDYLLGKTDEPTGIALEEGEEYEEILMIRRLYRKLSQKERNIIKTLLKSMAEEGKLE
ncbi:helix-turn-helix domain protein [Desulfofundulus kuznetsovii DSM 6115]|uniref:Helix-turn-helix domain protein n=1 Tax=Desulfofundulus kuznetsovii (strain DSM 6115 / VKM B-1805 / 17) TaxID=760568 RepID=A0AAU8PUA6_DESK7|nr:helix-turn-helix domain protein [Desulfofundulus kuznetsovii DSM 6115]